MKCEYWMRIVGAPAAHPLCENHWAPTLCSHNCVAHLYFFMHRFERYDANGDAWLSYEDALRWEGFVQDSLGVEPLLLQSECNPGACVPLLSSAGRLPPNFHWSRP